MTSLKKVHNITVLQAFVPQPQTLPKPETHERDVTITPSQVHKVLHPYGTLAKPNMKSLLEAAKSQYTMLEELVENPARSIQAINHLHPHQGH